MGLPEIEAGGLLFMADTHLSVTPPGHRLDGFMDQIMDKLTAGLEHAQREDLVPVILGDLFNMPRDNMNRLLVALIDLFRQHQPWVLIGNHDKHQARYTSDTSMAVLDAAGVINLMSDAGPQFTLLTSDEDGRAVRALIGASPDMTPLPTSFQKESWDVVIWCTHHNIGFPDFLAKPLPIKETPGVDWIVNGHIHRPQPLQVRGQTRWANIGSTARMAFLRRAVERKPAAAIWRPGYEDLEYYELPHLPYFEVFPEQDFPPEVLDAAARESQFVKGLERLAWRRTQEGLGLKEFLNVNLNPEAPEAELIWELYEEITHAKDPNAPE